MISPDSLPAFYNPGSLSGSEIRAMVNHLTGVSNIDFSFRLLDINLAPVDVPGGAPSDPSEMPPHYVQAAKTELNTQRDVPRQMSMDLVEGPGFSYDPLHHRVQPFTDYYSGGTWAEVDGNPVLTGGTRVLHIPAGVFMSILPDRDHGGYAPIWHLTLYDEIYRLSRLKFRNHYVFPAGTRWTAAARTLLTLPENGSTPAGCAISGPGFPASRVSIPDSASVMGVDTTFTQSDTFITAINLCLAGTDTPYWPLVQDEVGRFVSSPMPYYTTAAPSAGWVFDTRPGNPAIVQAPVKQSFGDVSTLANEVTVYAENPNAAAVSATAWNDSLDSAISRPNLGYTLNQIVNDNSITTLEQAQRRAALLLQSGAALNETLAFSCAPVPFIQGHDAIGFTMLGPGTARYTGSGSEIDVAYEPGPVVIDGTYSPFEVISMTLDMQTRIQSITAGRVVGV